MRIIDRLTRTKKKPAPDVIDPASIKTGTESMDILTRIADLKDAGKDVFVKAEKGSGAPVKMHVQEVDPLTFEEQIKKEGGSGFYRIYLVADDRLVTRPSDGKPEVYFLKIHGESTKAEKKREASEKSSFREGLDFAKEIMQMFNTGANAGMNPTQVLELVIKTNEALRGGSELDTAEKAFGFMQKVMEATQRPPVTTGPSGGWARALEAIGNLAAPFAQGMMAERAGLAGGAQPAALPQAGLAGAATATAPTMQTQPPPDPEQQAAQAGQLEITHLEELLQGAATPDEIAYYVLGDIRHYAERVPTQVPPQWTNYQQDPDAAIDAFAAWYPGLRADPTVYDQIKAAGRRLMERERALDDMLEEAERRDDQTSDSEYEPAETAGEGSGEGELEPASGHEGQESEG